MTAGDTGRAAGRNLIAVIGIDKYQRWRRLGNAVSDATGARALFRRLGFEEATPPLFDAAATSAALRALVTDDLSTLGAEDSLVVFYAGHGGSQSHQQDARTIKTGYLIPVDAEPDKVSTWLDLEGWLRCVSLLPPRHILVILDACHAGIALDPVIKWRDDIASRGVPFETLQRRRSRRVITSALDDERASDAGPVEGHSLFTGCLIEALTGGLVNPRGAATGSEVALWVQNRVRTYPAVQQTPDFGTFALDDRGEIVLPLLAASTAEVAVGSAGSVAPRRRRFASARPPTSSRLSVLRRLRDSGEWLMILAPLLVAGAVGLLARAC